MNPKADKLSRQFCCNLTLKGVAGHTKIAVVIQGHLWHPVVLHGDI